MEATREQFDAISRETYYQLTGQDDRLECIKHIPPEVKAKVQESQAVALNVKFAEIFRGMGFKS